MFLEWRCSENCEKDIGGKVVLIVRVNGEEDEDDCKTYSLSNGGDVVYIETSLHVFRL